jgi:U3 small nucleolar RNA-associated protein 23
MPHSTPSRMYVVHTLCNQFPLKTADISIFQAEQDALAPSTSERVVLQAAIPPTEPISRKKKRPKGPNPLSVKKKTTKHGVEEAKKGTKVVNTNQVEQVDVGSKRKRLDDAKAKDFTSTAPRPKRTRRHRRTSQLSEGVS